MKAASAGEDLVSAVLVRGNVHEFTSLRGVEDLLKPHELEAWDAIRDHVRRHGVLPSLETADDLEIDVDEEVPEPPSFYYEKLVDRHIRLTLTQAVADVNKGLKRNPREALDRFRAAIFDLTRRENPASIQDLRESGDDIYARYLDRLRDPEEGGGGLLLGWDHVDSMTGGIPAGEIVSVVGRPAQGKALPYGTPVVLHDGTTKAVEDLKVQDRLASVDGQPSEVFGVFHQGVREMYEMQFCDGRSIEADGEHLWEVSCKYWVEPRILTTKQVLTWRSRATRYRNTLRVRLHTGDFGGGSVPTVDPYLLGVLIGDGGLTCGSPYITTMDDEVLEGVRAGLPPGLQAVDWHRESGKARTYGLVGRRGKKNPLTEEMRSLGLWDHRSEGKFLPECVYAWSRGDRFRLLQGLLDTDGAAGPDGQVTYSSSSSDLVEGVVKLVRSLGGWARTQKPRHTSHLDHWRCSISLAGTLFTVARKAERLTGNPRSSLRIMGVRPAGHAACACIAVTHPSRLYLAGPYVVTHNTQMLLWAALNAWRNQRKSVVFASMEMKPDQIMDRMIAMDAGVAMDELLVRKGRALLKPQQRAFKNHLEVLGDYDVPLHIVDGSITTTIQDLAMLVRQLRPDALFIDGAYFIRSENQRLDGHQLIREVCHQLKALVIDMGIQAVCTWQVNREGAKGKRGPRTKGPGMENIAGSAAIEEISALILALMEKAGNPKTWRSRTVETWKGRQGEAGNFEIRWDWNGMDFGQLPEDHDSPDLYGAD